MGKFVADSASIDLNRIAVFVRVVETGSFTTAAARLRLPKSSVSRKVAALETALGTRLLQRTTRRLRLTEAGRRYFERVRPLVVDLDEAAAEVATLGLAPRGTVRVSAADFSEGPLAVVVAAFARRHPDIHVDLTMTSRRVNLVDEGFDLAVRAGILEDSTLVARKIARSELKLYAAPAYLAEHGAPRRFRDLEAHDCILYRGSKGVFPWRLTGPRGAETVRPAGRLTADDMSFMRRLVVAGAGIGMLPDSLAETDVARGTLAPVLPAYSLRGGAIYVVSPPIRHLPARVALFRDHLLAELPSAFRQAAAGAKTR